MNIYGLYEDGELVFKGKAKDIGRKCYITKDSVYDYLRKNKKLLGKYEVRIIETNTESKKPNLTNFDKEINEIIRRLKLYGNTVLPQIKNSELETYIKALKKNGYDVDVKCYNAKTGKQIRLEGSLFNKNKYDIDYIVELKQE